jgi:hypothetical protein
MIDVELQEGEKFLEFGEGAYSDADMVESGHSR